MLNKLRYLDPPVINMQSDDDDDDDGFDQNLWSSRQLQAQKLRLTRNQGPYYGGSLPNVNQIGRNPQDFQVSR